MKRKLLPLLIAGIAATGATAATAGVTVYGKANVSVQSNDSNDGAMDTQDNWTLNSNASRLGVKGSKALGDTGLKAIYKVEYEVYFDDGDDGSGVSELKQRNTYIGLTGDFGTIIGGKHDTPLKLAQGKVDRFNDLDVGDIKNVIEGENRLNNSVIYTTPSIQGLSASVGLVLNEEDGVDGDNDDKNGLTDSTSISVQWKGNGARVAVANDADVDGLDVTRFVGEFGQGPWKVGALHQVAEPAEDNDTDIEQKGTILSGELKVASNIKLKLQYGMSETSEDGQEDIEIDQIAFGADYKLDKKNKLYFYYAKVTEEQGSVEIEDKTFGVGIESKF